MNYNLIENMSSAAKKVDVECAELNAADIDDFLRISDENREIIRSNFLSLRAPTKILIHGYTGSYRDNRMAKIKDGQTTFSSRSRLLTRRSSNGDGNNHFI